MKRITTFIIVTLLMSYMASMPMFAQIRKSNEVPKLVKNASRTRAFQFSSYGFGWKSVPYEFVSLKDIDSVQLTNTEKQLLKTFLDVAFCFKDSKVHCCYWVKDSEENLGLVKFDGTVLVPPLKGRILQGTHPDRIIIGEQTLTSDEWMNEYHERVTTFTGIGLGHFAAVVDGVKDEKKIRATIPAGEYDDIMLGIKGTHTYYFVAKIIDGETKWGVVDKDGQEVMPVEAKGIYKKKGAASWLVGNVGGKWKASETMDMSQIENMVRNEERIAQQRRAQLAQTLMSLAETLEASANIIGQAQQLSGGETSVNGGGSIGGTLENQYKQWENRAKANYNSLTNLGLRAQKNGKDAGGTTGKSMSSSTYTSMKKSLREAQQQMKSIRSKASRQGIKISKSEYEDISVKF